MARKRMIWPGFWTDEKLCDCGRDERLLYMGLISNADDKGRGIARAAIVKSQVFPCDEDITPSDVEGWLKNLHEKGMIELYEADGHGYYSVRHFLVNQTINRPTDSVIPPPLSEECVSDTGALTTKGKEKDKDKNKNKRIPPTEEEEEVTSVSLPDVVYETYASEIGRVTAFIKTKLLEYADLDDSLIICAMDEAARCNKKSLGYVTTILDRYRKECVKTPEEARRKRKTERYDFDAIAQRELDARMSRYAQIARYND